MKRFLFFIFSIFFGLSINFCSADIGGFEIADYNVNVDLLEDGSMTVVEKITVDFLEERHGIYRDIKTQYFVGDTWFEIFVSNASVSGFQYKNTDGYENYSIRIGSPDFKVDGRQVYEISYDVYGGVKKYSGYQELYWNLVGVEWDTKIKHFDFILNFNKVFSGIQNEDVFTYHGYYGLQGTGNMEARFDEAGVWGEVFIPLEANQAFTIGVKFPKDFYLLDDERQESLLLYEDSDYDYKYTPTRGGYDPPMNNKSNFMVLGMILFIFFWIYFWLYKRNYTKNIRIKKIMTPYYSAPKGISASEAGVLIDDKLDAHDITALIYVWAAAGYITIEERGGKGIFTKKTYWLHKTKKKVTLGMKSYEKILFNKLFLTKTSFNLKSSSTFTSYVKTTINKLESYVLNKNRYTIKSIKNKPSKTFGNRAIFVIFGFLINCTLVFGITEWIFDAYQQQLNDLLILLNMFLGFVMFIWLFFMPKQEILTEKGVELRYHLLGFKHFLKKVEVNMLKTFLKEDPLYFDKILPFAVVFGLQTQFIKKITPLLQKVPEWYEGDMRGFQSTLISSVGALNKASHYTPPSTSSSYSSSSGFSSSSSSFSSGGGSSGGGGGGGGGGSW